MDDGKFSHKKSLGQHFLNSDIVPKWMCDAIDVNAKDTVFEIGPGAGALTAEILSRGAKTIALEADARALAILNEKFVAEIASGQLTLVKGDARNIDFVALNLDKTAYKCVANIPYYLSGLLFRALLETAYQPTNLVYLVQKEVAVRIARNPKESILSLAVKAYGQPKYIKTVTAGHFTPPPKVDSAIIAITEINKHNFSGIDEATFFKVIHLAFGQKRKQLRGNFAELIPRENVEKALKLLGYPDTVRAEDIKFSDWFPLLNHLFSPTVKIA